MNKNASSVCSMTGFATKEKTILGHPARMELRSLNHRYLDIKLRIPKEFSSIELFLRKALQSKFNRGSMECKLEFLPKQDVENTEHDIQLNLSLAAHYYESLNTIRKTLGLTEEVKMSDIIHFPNILSLDPKSQEAYSDSQKLWDAVEPLLTETMDTLFEMRSKEGKALQEALTKTVQLIKEKTAILRKSRKANQSTYQDKIQGKIQSAFSTFPIQDATVQAVMESRISQELAVLLDRTDIEEELTRLEGHVEHFFSTLNKGSPTGRKLDFILQEMNRETNTIGNKAQDFGISADIVEMKVAIEQLREQVMNLE